MGGVEKYLSNLKRIEDELSNRSTISFWQHLTPASRLSFFRALVLPRYLASFLNQVVVRNHQADLVVRFHQADLVVRFHQANLVD